MKTLEVKWLPVIVEFSAIEAAMLQSIAAAGWEDGTAAEWLSSQVEVDAAERAIEKLRSARHNQATYPVAADDALRLPTPGEPAAYSRPAPAMPKQPSQLRTTASIQPELTRLLWFARLNRRRSEAEIATLKAFMLAVGQVVPPDETNEMCPF